MARTTEEIPNCLKTAKFFEGITLSFPKNQTISFCHQLTVICREIKLIAEILGMILRQVNYSLSQF